MARNPKTLQYYLDKYYEMQDSILVCYRPKTDSSWSDRCLYLSDSYDANKEYNHRSILKNEVVIEFDDKDKDQNKKNALEVAHRLRSNGFMVSIWSSGNKSTHVHTFIEIGEAKSVPLLKNCFIRQYTKDLPLPDLQLCADNHLIRAEFGVNEKTGEKKTLINQDTSYPVIKRVPEAVWDRYTHEKKIIAQRRISMDLNDISTLPGFQFILTTDEFRKADDARERALFMLIHILKKKYLNDKPKFLQYLQDWYSYSGGRQLTPRDIENKLNYHWTKQYNIGQRYLNELLESIGRSDLCK